MRERLGIHTGSTVAFELTDSGEVVRVRSHTLAAPGGPGPEEPVRKAAGAGHRKNATEEILALTRGR